MLNRNAANLQQLLQTMAASFLLSEKTILSLQVVENVQAEQAPSSASGSATPVGDTAEDAAQGLQSAATSTTTNATEQGYTDTIQTLLSELWKERLVSSNEHAGM